jgi:hypothetical protein
MANLYFSVDSICDNLLITKEQLIRSLDFGESFTQEIKLYTEVTVERTYGFEPIELSSSQIARIFEFNLRFWTGTLQSQMRFLTAVSQPSRGLREPPWPVAVAVAGWRGGVAQPRQPGTATATAEAKVIGYSSPRNFPVGTSIQAIIDCFMNS